MVITIIKRPYTTYCNSKWSSTYVSNLNRIYYLQKRAVRAVTNSDYRAHTASLFSKLKILDNFQVNTLDIAKFMFRYHNNLLPPLFLNLFMTNRTAGNYVPVKSKLQHLPRATPRAFAFFENLCSNSPPPRAEKLFKCPHPHVPSGEERGLISQTGAGNRA